MIVFEPFPDLIPINRISFIKVIIAENRLVGCTVWNVRAEKERLNEDLGA
jgi:hypothetical protein